MKRELRISVADIERSIRPRDPEGSLPKVPKKTEASLFLVFILIKLKNVCKTYFSYPQYLLTKYPKILFIVIFVCVAEIMNNSNFSFILWLFN